MEACGDWTGFGSNHWVRPGMRLVQISRNLAPATSADVLGEVRKGLLQNGEVALLFMEDADTDIHRPLIARSASRCVEPLPQEIQQNFRASNPGPKALFLDYDGTLVEFFNKPEDAVPNKQLLYILMKMNQRGAQDLDVTIVSGRDKFFLDQHFGHYENFTLVAEHGYYVRYRRPRALLRPSRSEMDDFQVHESQPTAMASTGTGAMEGLSVGSGTGTAQAPRARASGGW